MHYYTKLAKKLMEEDRYTCVICGEGITYFSEESGVRPLMQWTAEKINVKGCCAADKIVGKAAALLYVGLGVREVYASVMSRRGEETLKKHGIEAIYGELCEDIRNRTDTDICPMEKAVREAETPAEAVEAIKAAIKAMQAHRG